jgi:hypothetical protein
MHAIFAISNVWPEPRPTRSWTFPFAAHDRAARKLLQAKNEQIEIARRF